VGAYKLLHQIGAGGMGAVWLAEHTMLGRRAAVKILHGEYTHRSEIVQRFFNEARAATAISDPGIVQVFDFGEHTDGTAYIVMELLEGPGLDKRVRDPGPKHPAHPPPSPPPTPRSVKISSPAPSVQTPKPASPSAAAGHTANHRSLQRSAASARRSSQSPAKNKSYLAAAVACSKSKPLSPSAYQTPANSSSPLSPAAPRCRSGPQQSSAQTAY